jgi:RNA-directed DNA polymerase
LVQQWVSENELTLHPTKTRIVDARTEGFDFLGYHFRGKLRLPREKSLKKLKDAVREKTKRCNGQCMLYVCARLSSQLRGWFAYFRHCQWSIFRDLDGWIRGRLRSILRKRQKRRGRARRCDHQRWPNAFFDEQRLYSLSAAHARFVQSSRR